MSDTRISRKIAITDQLGHHFGEQSVLTAIKDDAAFEGSISLLYEMLAREHDRLLEELTVGKLS